jgi:ribosomal subunit interface protein
MKYHIQFGTHIGSTPTVTNYVEKKMPAIERLFKKYADDEVKLDIQFDKIPDKEEYWTSMNLSLHSTVFHVEEEGFDAFSSIDAAKKSLISEIKTFKEKSKKRDNNKHEWIELIEIPDEPEYNNNM